MDVAAWLEELGLAAHATTFADNDITPELLSTLTDDDLKELGVRSLGHRKKILLAVTALTPDPPDLRAARSAVRGQVPDGEKRPVTVMFADISGFTTLSVEIGAERCLGAVSYRLGTRVGRCGAGSHQRCQSRSHPRVGKAAAGISFALAAPAFERARAPV